MMHTPVVYTLGVSDEPLDIIRANECECQVGSLATKRYRALWNEIERLRASEADLLTSLKRAEDLYARSALLANDSACGPWINLARDAIAKAEGRS